MTIKIKSSDERTQGPFVVINRADFDPVVHELADGETLGDDTGALISVSSGPSVQEMVAEAARLEQLRADLAAEAEQVRVQSADNLAEAGRLVDLRAELENETKNMRDETAQLAIDRAAFDAGKFAAAPDLSSLTKEQLQAALDEKGIKYPAAANKTDLQALLAAA